jgi:hypothetical protein
MGLPFMSPEWCEEALRVTNANEAIYRGFKDGKTFTNKMEWRTPGVGVTHQEWDAGRMVYFGPPKFEESEIWIVLEGGVEAWRAAAEGEADGARLLMGGQIKLVKGPISACLENASAFNVVLENWGNVDTEWPE